LATFQILDAKSAGKHAANLASDDKAKTVPNTIGFQPVAIVAPQRVPGTRRFGSTGSSHLSPDSGGFSNPAAAAAWHEWDSASTQASYILEKQNSA